MFDLFDKLTGERITIFGVMNDDHGYPKFLIRKNNQWLYRSAKHFLTYEESLRQSFELVIQR
jgi:hypothetical protein